MNITVFGTGYVGLVTGVCLAELGNDVLCVDIDARKIAILNAGDVPIHEPGLRELIASNSQANRLTFTTDSVRGVAHGDIQFIAVGTPSSHDGAADLHYVFDVARTIATHMESFKVVVNKSTVPVGSAEKVQEAMRTILAKRHFHETPAPEFAVISNPEFLKEGSAIDDFMRPDRIIVGFGGTHIELAAGALMRELYRPFCHNRDRVLCMDVRSAEFTKYVANAMLATRISFMNEMANLADRIGADIESVRIGIGSDPRIGDSFLYPGTGYGGSCFPKDVAALRLMGSDTGMPLRVLQAVADVNEDQKRLLVHKLTDQLGNDLTGRKIGVWGLAFKPNTDDMREAPSRTLINDLLQRGATVRVFDPVAMTEAKRCFSSDLSTCPELLAQIEYAQDPLDAASDADALVIVTEWQVFRSPNFAALKLALKTPLILDGRNLYEPKTMRDLGFDYIAIGRRS